VSETLDRPEEAERAQALLRRLFAHRRLSGRSGACAAEPCAQCLALHLPRVEYFLRAGLPLHFLLPAFPAKSPSRRKTLGPLPDMAEEQALLYLQGVCDELGALHAPGLRVTVCPDGAALGDLLGVPDDDVIRYGEELGTLLGRLGCRSLETFAPGDDFAEVRRRLTADYCRPLEQVVQRAKGDASARALVDGIHQALFEDQADVQPKRNRGQLRQECRGLAYQMVQRGDAWDRLLAERFPEALLLSAYPQHAHAEKVGILLGRSDDAWLMPWRGVALRTADGWKLVQRSEAEALGARLLERDGRPSHFEVACSERVR
jgi:pyoverdine/dityrosine biosynthesis protein Dit1